MGNVEELLEGIRLDVAVLPVDARLYTAAGVVLAAVALCASALPAWRATRVNPRQALAAE